MIVYYQNGDIRTDPIGIMSMRALEDPLMSVESHPASNPQLSTDKPVLMQTSPDKLTTQITNTGDRTHKGLPVC